MAPADEHDLFDLFLDRVEERKLSGTDRRVDTEMGELMRVALHELEADEHLERVGSA